MSETDEQFVERISREVYPGFDGWRTVSMMDHSLDRLITLARRGAEAADRIAQLEAALRWYAEEYNYTDAALAALGNAHERVV